MNHTMPPNDAVLKHGKGAVNKSAALGAQCDKK